MGTEDVKVTAINMYKYKERLRLYKRWTCSTYSIVVSSLLCGFLITFCFVFASPQLARVGITGE